MSGLRAEILREPEDLAELVPQWWDLLRRSPEATPFQSPAWLLRWWEIFAPGSLASIALHDGERLVGLAPLYLETTPDRVRLLPLGIGLSDYCDILVDPECAQEVRAGTMAALPRLGRWDECEFPELSQDSAVCSLPSPSWARQSQSAASITPILALRSDLRATIPPAKHRKLRLARNRARRRGELAIVAGDGGNWCGLLSELVRLHAACWHAREQVGVFADARVERFHMACMPDLMSAGLVRLYGVLVGGKVIAVYYGFRHGDRAYAYLQGFDPEFSYESPGTIVVAHAIEQAILEGAMEFDFLRGEESYKFQWGAKSRHNTRRVYVREASDAAA